jgi:hypothetical protein
MKFPASFPAAVPCPRIAPQRILQTQGAEGLIFPSNLSGADLLLAVGHAQCVR